jgi:hypothetical protein
VRNWSRRREERNGSLVRPPSGCAQSSALRRTVRIPALRRRPRPRRPRSRSTCSQRRFSGSSQDTVPAPAARSPSLLPAGPNSEGNPGAARGQNRRISRYSCRSRSTTRPAGPGTGVLGSWRRRADSNRRIRVLQTLALPLGHVAEGEVLRWAPGYESGSRLDAPRGGGRRGAAAGERRVGRRGPDRVQRGDLERETGLEPATPTLARLCSTTELFPPTAAKNMRRVGGCQAGVTL